MAHISVQPAARSGAMPESVNRQILLKSRPEAAPSLANFELARGPVPQPDEGEVLMRTLYLSLDPYMRGRMSDAKSYAKPADIGQPMVGFFFQAEDGIRDADVTGVQTYALPI